MAGSVFNSKLVEPDDKMMAYELGETKEYFDRICDFIENDYGDLRPEWKFYNIKSGWILKLFNKKRNVLFIVPCTGYFRTVFTFGDKAVEAVLKSTLPDKIKETFMNAKKYMEGRTIQLEIKSEDELKNIFQLIRIKLNTK